MLHRNQEIPKQNSKLHFQVETLESRQMLSTVQVFAAGTTGVEQIQLSIDGIVVATYDDIGAGADSGSFQTRTYSTSQNITADQVRIEFINDSFDPDSGIDRNVRIDAIAIDGVRFETESPKVFSTGTWLPEDGVQPGFGRGEYLHSQGYFQFSGGTTTEIIVNASGSEGIESFALQIDGQTVQTWDNIDTSIRSYDFTANGNVTADQVRIVFLNDQWDPVAGIDANLIVDNISIGGIPYETEAESVFSTGTWLDGSVVDGFGRGDTLHVNGYFQFSSNATNAPPIAHWSFDSVSDNQTPDISNNGNNHAGTLRSGISLIEAGGPLGGALNFDGQGTYISVDDSTDINLGTHPQLTVTSWFKVDNSTIFLPNEVEERKQVIYEQGGVSNGLNIYIENGVLYAGVWVDGIWEGTYLSTNEIESYKWHQVTVVLDASPGSSALQPNAFRAYLDGVEFGSGSAVELPNHTGNIGIGGISQHTQFHNGELRTNGTDNFAGDIADLKIYDQAISAEAITADYNLLANAIDLLNDSRVVDREIVVSGLAQPEAIDWIPNTNTMLIVEKAGTVRVFEDGTLLTNPFIDISDQVNNDGFNTRGISDIAIHPDFEQNPYVYLFFTYDPPEVYEAANVDDAFAGPDHSGVRSSRVIRVTADVNSGYKTAVAGSEVVLIGSEDLYEQFGAVNPFADDAITRNNPSGTLADGTNVQDYIAVESNFHNSGSIAFGPDGALYVSTGDATAARVDLGAYRSQDIDNLSGKVLRIDPITGEGLSDNPFYDGDPDSNRSKVYQYGLRNPFRFAIHPDTGLIYTGDTGWRTFEEINVGGAGVNFGWPYFEGAQDGNSPTPLFEDLVESQNFYANPTLTEAPIISLAHGSRSISTVMGDFYFGNAYPEQYQGDLFYVDPSSGVVRNVSFDASGNVAAVDVFTTRTRVVSQIAEGPDQQLYYVDLAAGWIARWKFDDQS